MVLDFQPYPVEMFRAMMLTPGASIPLLVESCDVTKIVSFLIYFSMEGIPKKAMNRTKRRP